MSSTRTSEPQAVVPDRISARHAALSGGVTAGIGVGGVALGLLGVFRGLGPVHLGWLVPLIGIQLCVDPLGGLFMSVTGAVAVAVGIYAVGYCRLERLPRFSLVVLPVFVAGMLLVPAAASVTTFLLAWELMAAASLVLVLTEHHRRQVRAAGVFYAVLTQVGFAAILLALMVLSAAGHADSFAALSSSSTSATVRSVVFAGTLVGFGSKAGLLPLHAWLPRAHPEAPSPVSALMSAAMVGIGLYGIVRIDVQVLGAGPRWWGLTLLILGGLSAVFGVLHASVAADLKRLLAYSTTENMGLITLALGAALLLRSSGAPDLAAVALTAALVHVIGHAAFKTLGFLAAGSVLVATGLRDLDRLGGLAARMPETTLAFGIAALGAAGLPVGAGFVGEWLLLQSLIHAPHDGHTLLALAMPLAVGAVALTTGLGVAAMVKAFGIGFLARPRSDAAANAGDTAPSMLAGMGVAAVACLGVAMAPQVLGGLLHRVVDQLWAPAGQPGFGVVVRLPGVAGSISPLVIAGTVAVASVSAICLGRVGARRRPASAVLPLWACGADRLSPRMEYTATSFAEPLQRVFDDVLRPDTDVQVSHYAESQYLVAKVAYSARLSDAIEDRVYTPVVRATRAVAAGVQRAHSGSVHLYLGYGAVGLLLVLVLAR